MKLLIALDQLLNVLLLGSPDETLSARAFRCRYWSVPWFWLWKAIDTLFFWEPQHCEAAYRNEVARNHMPESYRLTK